MTHVWTGHVSLTKYLSILRVDRCFAGVNVKKRLLNCGVLWRLDELFNCLT